MLIGGTGGQGFAGSNSGTLGLGGHGAQVTANVAVTQGEVIFVEVGGNGANGVAVNCLTSIRLAVNQAVVTKGYNGGAEGGTNECANTAGQGGGATDLRTVQSDASPATCPDGTQYSGGDSSLSSRILIAGGGGGGGNPSNVSTAPGGDGGTAGGSTDGGAGGAAGQFAGSAGANGGVTQPCGGSGGFSAQTVSAVHGTSAIHLTAVVLPTTVSGGGGGGGAGSSYAKPGVASAVSITPDAPTSPGATISFVVATPTPTPTSSVAAVTTPDVGGGGPTLNIGLWALGIGALLLGAVAIGRRRSPDEEPRPPA